MGLPAGLKSVVLSLQGALFAPKQPPGCHEEIASPALAMTINDFDRTLRHLWGKSKLLGD